MKRKIQLLIFIILTFIIISNFFIIKPASASVETKPIEAVKVGFCMEDHIKEARDLVCESTESIFWKKCMNEYPIATKIWLYMKNELEYSDIVCAGIMGNFMAETGGRTLALNPNARGSNGLGLVQWIGGRRTAIQNRYGSAPTLEQQLDFMNDELYGINTTKQVTDSQLNKIINASSPEDCAYAFACYYERCATEYRSLRRGLARKAYEYFVKD